MFRIPGKRQDRVRYYFLIIEAGVVALMLLFHFGGYRVLDLYGVWPAVALLGLLGLLLFSCLLVLGTKRQRLAIVGFLVIALVLAHGFLFPVIVP